LAISKASLPANIHLAATVRFIAPSRFFEILIMTMQRFGCLMSVFAFTVFLIGCSGGVREETIEVKASNDPLTVPRNILQRYADGQPLGSELTSFPKLVEDVRKVDTTRADVLEKGLAEIEKAAPGQRAGLAKGLLAKLQPAMK